MRIDKKIAGIKRNRLLSGLFIVGYILLILSCMSFKPGGAEVGKNLYETFYTGEEGTQYFIKPLTFGGENKNQMKVDFTFRYKDTIKDSVVVNMSFLNKEIIKDLDSVKITNGTTSIVLINIKCLFAERREKEFHSRFSAKASLDELNKLFDKNNWSLTASGKHNSGTYTTPKGTERKILKLKEGVFLLF